MSLGKGHNRAWNFIKPTKVTLIIFVPLMILTLLRSDTLGLWSPLDVAFVLIYRIFGIRSDFFAYGYYPLFLVQTLFYFYCLSCLGNFLWKRRKSGKKTTRILESLLILSAVVLVMTSSFLLTTPYNLRWTSITDNKSCSDLWIYGATTSWDSSSKTCILQSSMTIGRSDLVSPDKGITLKIENSSIINIVGTLANSGTIFNSGKIIVSSDDYGVGFLGNGGKLANTYFSTVINDGIIENNHSIYNSNNSTILNNKIINNRGEFFSEDGYVTNSGIIENYCGSAFRVSHLNGIVSVDDSCSSLP